MQVTTVCKLPFCHGPGSFLNVFESSLFFLCMIHVWVCPLFLLKNQTTSVVYTFMYICFMYYIYERLLYIFSLLFKSFILDFLCLGFCKFWLVLSLLFIRVVFILFLQFHLCYPACLSSLCRLVIPCSVFFLFPVLFRQRFVCLTFVTFSMKLLVLLKQFPVLHRFVYLALVFVNLWILNFVNLWSYQH